MPSHDDEFYSRYPRSGPRTTRGGIKAQSARGNFAKSWWASRWISVLESFDIGTRLNRGKTYARKGQVISIEIGVGVVKASVQGSAKKPYSVTIQVKTIPQEKWAELAKTEFRQAIVAAKLIAGEMPEDVERNFEASGISLFPQKSGDLKTDCSCPDYSNPCKHIAAVYYLLGEEFDRDPFLIFRLRGIEKETLLAIIMGSREGAEATDVSTKPKKGRKKPGRLEAHQNSESKEQTISENLLSFWSTRQIPEDLIGPVKVPPIPATLPKRLGNIPFWRGQNLLVKELEATYSLVSEAVTESLIEEASAESS